MCHIQFHAQCERLYGYIYMVPRILTMLLCECTTTQVEHITDTLTEVSSACGARGLYIFRRANQCGFKVKRQLSCK